MARIATMVLVPAGISTAAGQEALEKRFLTPDGSRPSGLFAPGVIVGKTVHIAGKGDYRPDEDFPEKVRNGLSEVRKTLQAAGLDMENVVKSFVYLEDPDKYAEMNTNYGEFFPNNPPARTTLGVAQVPGESRLEITCIATTDLTEKSRVGDPVPGFPYSPGVLAGETL